MGSALCWEAIYEEGGTHRFPLYWTSDLVPIMGYDPHKLNASYRETIYLLDQLCVMK